MQPQCKASLALFGKIHARSRWLARLVLASLLITAIPSCWKAKTYVEEPLPRQYEGVALTVACSEAANCRALVEQLAHDWSARTGASIEVLAGDEKADIQVIAPAELPDRAASGHLMEVPPDIRSPGHKYQWSEMPAVYAEKLLRWDGKAYAMPIIGEGHVLVYRTDRFAERRIGLPPGTWDDFVRIAEAVRAANGKPSLPPLPVTREGLDRLFFTIAAAYDRRVESEGNRRNQLEAMAPEVEDAFFSFHYSLAGKPRIDRPHFVHALELLQHMQKCRPSHGDPTEAFRSGNAVMMLAPLSSLARFQDDDSAVRDRFAIAPIPGAGFTFDFQSGERQDLDGTVNRVPYIGWGGCIGTVRRTCEFPEAAWHFLADIGDPVSTSLELIGAGKWGAGPTRLSHLEVRNRNAWFGYGLSADQTDRLIDQLRLNLAPGVANYRVRLRTPDEAPRLKALDQGLREAITTGANAAAALKKVADAWRELDKSLPPERRREIYRKSLGL